MLDKINFNNAGLVPAIAQDVVTGDVLMLAWMNEESILRSLEEKRAVYWSRSRQELWRKGDTSGHIQELVSASLDCDGDTILLKVKQTGPACHTGSKTCFFRDLEREISA
ncbi:MAG: phosphoribosyl-AMP cyclohydrolase [Alphaproteobacteria bacterium]